MNPPAPEEQPAAPPTPVSSDGDRELFPTAEIQSSPASPRLLQSKLWWVTLICFGVAVYLAWNAQRPQGIPITIEFPEGHGLKAGDALQHRGIEIGIVTDIALTDDHDGVQATVELDKTAIGIACAGSEFWIVRPQVSLTNISGLETAVGSKYIAVDPGPAGGTPLRSFIGRKSPPRIDMDNVGIEIQLRGAESFGLTPGSPVTYRGIDVGQITSVQLADDALTVLAQATIEQQHESLVREGSKFWKTSGVDVDIGFKGLRLSTDSLAAMARGGVSFSTPKSKRPADLKRVKSGHEFELHEALDDDWIRDAAPLSP